MSPHGGAGSTYGPGPGDPQPIEIPREEPER